MGFSARTISSMKWRTTFVALALLAFFTYGPHLRKEREQNWEQFGGRHLLQEDEEGSGLSDVDTFGDSTGSDGAEDVDCDASKPGYDDYIVFKTAMKRYTKSHADPGSIRKVCPTESKMGQICAKNIPPEANASIPEANRKNTKFVVTVDDCRTQNWTCWNPINGNVTYEPDFGADPMFPPDAFTEDQRASGAIVLHMMGLLYMFYALALVCDHYFVPTLDVIIEKWQISDDVAGATFMAAGGSAPELFTSVIGVFIAVSDVGIGTIVGSAVFNVLFVIAACAFASAEALKLTAWPLIRDTTFYSIALIVLVIFFLDDAIKWWEALILFLWYFCYVIFMKFNVTFETKFLELFPGLKKEGQEGQAKEGGFYAQRTHRKPLLQLMRGKVQGKAEETEMKTPGVGLEGLKIQLQNGEEDESKEPLKVEEEKGAEEEAEEPYVDYVRGGPGDSVVGKVMWALSLPLMIPMWVSIPDPQDKDRERYYPIAFVMSIVWIAVFSYFMVWWATLTGEALGISDAVMGLTFLAAGTSVPDLITSVLVAKEGKGDMAVSSSIGSNLFDVTVGLPLPWLLYTLIFQRDMEVNSVGIGCSIGMLFIMLLLVFVSIIAFNWEMTKPMGGVMMVLYLVFVIISLGLSECWIICPF
jgi:K+-dependent Na+/Ca+ exchanger-like protein